MDFYKVLYLFSVAILWACIFVNIWQFRRNRKLSSEYLDAIEKAIQAQDNYEQLWKNLNEERDYFRKLREQENNDEEI